MEAKTGYGLFHERTYTDAVVLEASSGVTFDFLLVLT